jgi:hypothetical protein
MTDDDTDVETCGHPKSSDDGYCQRDAQYDDGRCWQHSDLSGEHGDVGKPTKLDPVIQAEICEKLAKGHTHKAAAMTSTNAKGEHINYKTHMEWRARGRKEEGTIYSEYADATERANTEGMHRFEEVVIEETLPEDLKGRFGKAMELLRKRYQREWGGKGDESEQRTINVQFFNEDDDDPEGGFTVRPPGLNENGNYDGSEE